MMSKCPQTGTSGKQVDSATLKALLNVSLRGIQDVQYYFCDAPHCEIVYYSDDGSQTFTMADLSVDVYQKNLDKDDCLICYCFFHTIGDVKEAVLQSTSQEIIDNIQAGIKQGQCACDWRNPQGTCCLGNVRQLIKANTS